MQKISLKVFFRHKNNRVGGCGVLHKISRALCMMAVFFGIFTLPSTSFAWETSFAYDCGNGGDFPMTFGGCKPGYYYDNWQHPDSSLDPEEVGECIKCPSGYTCVGGFAGPTANNNTLPENFTYPENFTPYEYYGDGSKYDCGVGHFPMYFAGCKAGYYYENWQDANSSLYPDEIGDCIACPSGAICAGGFAGPLYWEPSYEYTDGGSMYDCGTDGYFPMRFGGCKSGYYYEDWQDADYSLTPEDVGECFACPSGFTCCGGFAGPVSGVVECGGGATVSGCSANQIDVNGDGSTCETAKFTITTTNTDSFEFYLSAAGTFYIDWGDGNTEVINKNNVGRETISHDYDDMDVYTIRLGGAATNYDFDTMDNGLAHDEGDTGAAISFVFNQNIHRISGSLGQIFGTLSNGKNPSFNGTFAASSLSGAIPENLFAGISGAPAESMFSGTFADCSGLTGSIPANLFAGISGAPAQYMFASTFHNCSGLTGAIPSNLFARISGAPAQSMFSYTFLSCSGLTGSIPENLFAGISGAPAQSMFENTFSGCSGLTGSIPANLFAGISGAPAQHMFNNTFYGCSGLTGSIPANLFAGISGAPESYMFNSTFRECSGLTRFTDGTNTVNYVPGNFLSGITTASSPTSQAQRMFFGTGLASSCPSGTTNTTRSNFTNAGRPWCGASYTITYNLNDGAFPVGVVADTSYITEMTPKTLPAPIRDGYNFGGWYDNAEFTGEAITEIPSGSTGNKEFWAKWIKASCPVDYFAPSDHPEMCFPHVLHIGDNTVYLKSTKQTTPSLNVGMGNDVFYANMTTTATPMNSATEQYLKIMYNNTVYYVCDDTTYNQ